MRPNVLVRAAARRSRSGRDAPAWGAVRRRPRRAAERPRGSPTRALRARDDEARARADLDAPGDDLRRHPDPALRQRPPGGHDAAERPARRAAGSRCASATTRGRLVRRADRRGARLRPRALGAGDPARPRDAVSSLTDDQASRSSRVDLLGRVGRDRLGALERPQRALGRAARAFVLGALGVDHARRAPPRLARRPPRAPRAPRRPRARPRRAPAARRRPRPARARAPRRACAPAARRPRPAARTSSSLGLLLRGGPFAAARFVLPVGAALRAARARVRVRAAGSLAPPSGSAPHAPAGSASRSSRPPAIASRTVVVGRRGVQRLAHLLERGGAGLVGQAAPRRT